MHTAATLTGMVAIVLFGVWGALFMSSWGIVAASGMPLTASIDAMEAANQPYSVLPGLLFAALGVVLGFAWVWLMWSPRVAVPAWAGFSLWAAIIALGGPAYFFASFGNINSVGDTFYGWDPAAAFAFQAPLYLVSAVAAVNAVGAPLCGPFLHLSPARRTQASSSSS